MGEFAVAADEVRIAYQVSGAGEPLVLLAGQSNSHGWWDPVRADFAAAYRTVTLDWRGTGDSDKPDVPYSTRGFADDVIAVLDALGIERAHVYGTSMGGRVRPGGTSRTKSGGGWRRRTRSGCAPSCWAAPRRAVRSPWSAATTCGVPSRRARPPRSGARSST
ncbi:hypothetical protein GCM10010417_21110 [Streptomyces carpaticus]